MTLPPSEDGGAQPVPGQSPGPAASEPPRSQESADSSETTKHETQAKAVVQIALDAGLELFRDDRDAPFARIETNKRRRILSIESSEFHKEIHRLGWREMGRALGREVLQTAVRTLAAMTFDAAQYDLHVRHARLGEALWIDLDGSRAVRISPGKWQVVDQPPILFRSFPHQRPFPNPVRGGDVWRLFDFVNISDESTRCLLLGFLVAAFQPDIPVAGLALHGVQGSAKTTFLRILKRLIDPSRPEVRGGVSTPEELAQVLYQNRFVVLDNLTHLRGWLSDMLCGAITGDGWSKRELYTNEDTIWFEYRRVIAVSGINLVAQRADLLDRCLIFELDPVRPEERREETAFWRAFEEALPQIFGALLDMLARALETHGHLEISAAPRMADTYRWGAAALVAIGEPATAFTDAYDRNVNRQVEAGLDANPAGQALLLFMQGQESWHGSPGILHGLLNEIVTDLGLDASPTWPKGANWLLPRLKEAQPLLARHGIAFETGRSAHQRTIRIWKPDPDGVIGVTAVTQRPDVVLPVLDSVDDAPATVTDGVTHLAFGLPDQGGDVARDGNDGAGEGVNDVAAASLAGADDALTQEDLFPPGLRHYDGRWEPR